METERLLESPPSSRLTTRLEQHRAKEAEARWQGKFSEYYEMVVENPEIAQLSHARIYDMIMAAGVDTAADGPKKYRFFSQELFGIEEPLEKIVDYFASAARRLEVRKRILLLMGPVGGGKSTIVSLLKRGLEEYSATEKGAAYAIKDCPMHEDPLHLIPDGLRTEIGKESNIYIEGDLCPVCRIKLQKDWDNRAEEVNVVRFTFSEKDRKGIGTFCPSDPKSQDISELTGSIDLATIGEYGVESDPRAYRFDGELNIANRGLMEFVEMLKCDEKFLYGLLTLSQEQNIKTGRFAMIYADETIISHTNEAEYNTFIANKRSEALQDRIILVRVPYNLKVSEEIKIYEKLLKASATKTHIAPFTTAVAAMIAVSSRLEEPQKAGMTRMQKMKLYDGQDVGQFSSKDVKEVRDQAGPREGMDGISPRYVINQLSRAIVKDGATCINPLDAIRALRDGLEQHPGYSKETKDALLALMVEVRKEYDLRAKTEVQRAFVYSFEESAQTLMNNYLDNIEAYANRQKLTDPITDEEVEPDEKLMRSIEEQIEISENGKKAFREEILIRLSSLARRNQKFEYTSHERLREAIEKKLFADLKDLVKITTSAKTPDPEQSDKFNEVAGTLEKDHGYCLFCSRELLKYVGELLRR